MKSFLHVGCGYSTKENLWGFHTDEWKEIRFDIDVNCKPDIVGTITDMSNVDSESVDALMSSHNIEHIHPMDVVPTLKEFKRVLKPDGFAVITCPDIMQVAQEIIRGKLMQTVYNSQSGPITPLDMMYGYIPFTKQMPYMEHKCAFTEKTMIDALQDAEFSGGVSATTPNTYALWVIATKNKKSDEEMEQLIKEFFPN
jgi:predicted SAM-dependent methyltransferase